MMGGLNSANMKIFLLYTGMEFSKKCKSFHLNLTSVKSQNTVTRIGIKTFSLDCFLKHFFNLKKKRESFSISMVAPLFAVNF